MATIRAQDYTFVTNNRSDYRGFDRGETATVPANPRKHPAGMHPAAFTKKEKKITPVV
jgi:hypothetical protein